MPSFDVVSEGELYRVGLAGGAPEKTVFAGVGKTEHEISAVWIASERLAFALDTLAGYTINDVLSSGARGDFSWQAATLAAKYNFNSRYFISPRIEGFWAPPIVTSETPGTCDSFCAKMLSA